MSELQRELGRVSIRSGDVLFAEFTAMRNGNRSHVFLDALEIFKVFPDGEIWAKLGGVPRLVGQTASTMEFSASVCVVAVLEFMIKVR